MELVRIAGAGPAGLCAALLLARDGVRAEVREPRPFVGARFRGCVHGIENWTSPEPFQERLEAWGLDAARILVPCRELLICDERTSHRMQFPVPLFYLVIRGPDAGQLEGELLRSARQAGALVKFGERFPSGEIDLNATGPGSGRRVCVEAGVQFRTRSPDVAVGLISRTATPAGYAYLLICSGRGSFSAVRFDGRGVDQGQLRDCERLLRRHVSFEMSEARPSAGYGTFRLQPQFQREASWCAGEASGLQDFLWGFGIRRALESGALAARAWLTGSDYPSLARTQFGIPDRASVVNRYLWDKTAAWGFRGYLSSLCRQGDTREALRRATQMRLIHRLAYPLLRGRLQRHYPHLEL